MDRELAKELADWLAHMCEWNEKSVAAKAPEFQAHIANLRKWETAVRELLTETSGQ